MSLNDRQKDGPQLPGVHPSDRRLYARPPSVFPVAQFEYTCTKTSHDSQLFGQAKLTSVPDEAQCGHEKWYAPFRYDGHCPQNL